MTEEVEKVELVVDPIREWFPSQKKLDQFRKNHPEYEHESTVYIGAILSLEHDGEVFDIHFYAMDANTKLPVFEIKNRHGNKLEVKEENKELADIVCTDYFFKEVIPKIVNNNEEEDVA